jgi:hypothetical protein
MSALGEPCALSGPAAAVGSAGENPVSFTRPSAGALLRAGETVEIRWSGVPAGAEEIELLLSLDGGRHFSIRLSEELDADEGNFLWRVPNLVSEGASLAIRMGRGGHEIMSAGGPLFRIEHDGALGRPALAWRAEEIWLDPEAAVDENGGSPAPPPHRMSAPAELASLPADSRGALLPRFLRAPGSTKQRDVQSLPASPDSLPPARIASRIPTFIPQRI